MQLYSLDGLRKQPTFWDTTTGCHHDAKWGWRNEYRNSVIMMCHYPALGSASDWMKQISLVMRPIRSNTKIWVVSHLISILLCPVLWHYFHGETSGDIVKINVSCFLTETKEKHAWQRNKNGFPTAFKKPSRFPWSQARNCALWNPRTRLTANLIFTCPFYSSLRSRRLEVVGERENGCARGRHAATQANSIPDRSAKNSFSKMHTCGFTKADCMTNC